MSTENLLILDLDTPINTTELTERLQELVTWANERGIEGQRIVSMDLKMAPYEGKSYIQCVAQDVLTQKAGPSIE